MPNTTNKTTETARLFGLPQQTIGQIQEVFAQYSVVKKVLVYGSRAKGNYSNGSDIDLTMYGEYSDSISYKVLLRIDGQLDDLPIPYTIDLSVFDSLEHDKLRVQIEKFGKVFYQRADVAWKTVKLGDVLKTGAGGTPLKSKKEFYKNGTVSWLMSGAVCEKEITFSDTYITELGLANSSAKIFPPNTVLVAMYGATAGQVGILRFPSAANQAVCGIYPHESYLPEYLYYYLLEYKSILLEETSGVAQPNLSQIKIKNVLIPSLPLAKQKRIVAKLDAVFAEIDKAIAAARRKCEEVETFKDALLSAELTRNNKNWKTVKLGEVISFDKINGLGSNLPYLGMENISSSTMQIIGELQIPEKTSNTFLFHDEHVLFGRLRPYLAKVLVPDFEGQCSTEIFCLLPSKKIVRKFLSYWFLVPTILQKINATSTGARMPRANMNTLLEFPLPLPPLPEQKRIVAKLDAIFAQAELAKAAITQQLKQYQALKSALLTTELQSEAL